MSKTGSNWVIDGVVNGPDEWCARMMADARKKPFSGMLKGQGVDDAH